MAGFKDITGMKFARLTAISRANNIGVRVAFNFKCDCGAEIVARRGDVTNGKHRSCGCLHIDAISKHGMLKKGEPLPAGYGSWNAMRQRCNNPKNDAYHRYGGRGITICERWDSFDLFIADMGAPVGNVKTIERIDRNGNYEPSNCTWITQSDQTKNRSWAPPKIPRSRNSKGHYC